MYVYTHCRLTGSIVSRCGGGGYTLSPTEVNLLSVSTSMLIFYASYTYLLFIHSFSNLWCVSTAGGVECELLG